MSYRCISCHIVAYRCISLHLQWVWVLGSFAVSLHIVSYRCISCHVICRKLCRKIYIRPIWKMCEICTLYILKMCKSYDNNAQIVRLPDFHFTLKIAKRFRLLLPRCLAVNVHRSLNARVPHNLLYHLDIRFIFTKARAECMPEIVG